MIWPVRYAYFTHRDWEQRMTQAEVATPTSIDSYLAMVAPAHRAALAHVREVIHAAAPTASECISYGIPAFRLHGKVLIYFGAAAAHCALYGVRERRKGEFKNFNFSGRGTLRFTPETPLPDALIRSIVKTRAAELAATVAAAKAPTRSRKNRPA
jgi:uncharacterized protein YdhG (YjbR/CyaY superfamily)